jgi:aspartate kinase
MGSKDLLSQAVVHLQQQRRKGYQSIVVVSAFHGVTDALISIIDQIKKELKKEEFKRADLQKMIDTFMDQLEKKHFDIIHEHAFSVEIGPQLMEETSTMLRKLRDDLNVMIRFGVLPLFQDMVLSFGEKLACLFFASLVQQHHIPAVSIMSDALGIMTDSNFLDANILEQESTDNVQRLVQNENDVVPVLTGFIGKNEEGQTTTLGRGGSDTLACFIASAVHASKVILWKEVPGVLSADPLIVSHASTIPFLSYDEAEESGKVICDKAVRFLRSSGIRAEVTFIQDEKQKTSIGPAEKDMIKGVKIISSRKNLSLLTISDERVKKYGFLFEISKIFHTRKVNMVLIRNTRDTLFIVVDNGINGNLKESLEDFQNMGIDMHCFPVQMVYVIGNLDWETVNIFNRILLEVSPEALLGAFPYTKCVRLEAIVKDNEVERAIQAFHKTFIS